jgi:hypothetical protein
MLRLVRAEFFLMFSMFISALAEGLCYVGLRTLCCVGAGVRRQGIALWIGPR